MKKILLFLSIFIILILFIAIMNSGYILKNSYFNNDDVIGQLKLVEAAVYSNDWEKAGLELDKSFKAWEKVKNRIQFSVERGHLERIDQQLATLKGTVKVKNSIDTIISIEEIKVLWEELAR